MKKVIVELKNFCKSYENKEIIKDLNLEVYEGEFLTLLGSSGCGKTTILRSIAGLDRPNSGAVYIDGEDVTDVPASQRGVNTLFQNYALFPLMTVEKNIEFGLKMKKIPKEERQKRIKNMLELVKLEGYENRKPRELSGGEQQRVSIARGLANQPKVLLLDEPLSALDMKLRKQMHIELKALQKKLGITFIYVTHDQDEALSMSDRICLLRNGVIEQLDTPSEIYNHPKSTFVADFIGDANIFTGTISEITDKHALVKLDIGDIIKVMNEEFEIGDKVSVIIRPENLKIVNKSDKMNSLEVTVRDFIYDGFYTNAILEAGKMRNIKATVLRHIPDIPKKSTVFLEWNIVDAIVIKEKNEKKKK